jgi:hypothetical protein
LIVELKARNMNSKRNQLASTRKDDILVGLEQAKDQLNKASATKKVQSGTKATVLRVIYDNDRGKSSTAAAAEWEQEASDVRKEWIESAPNAVERASRERVNIVTTTRTRFSRATAEIKARIKATLASGPPSPSALMERQSLPSIDLEPPHIEQTYWHIGARGTLTDDDEYETARNLERDADDLEMSGVYILEDLARGNASGVIKETVMALPKAAPIIMVSPHMFGARGGLGGLLNNPAKAQAELFERQRQQDEAVYFSKVMAQSVLDTLVNPFLRHL